MIIFSIFSQMNRNAVMAIMAVDWTPLYSEEEGKSEKGIFNLHMC